MDIEREKDQMLTCSMENEATIKQNAFSKSSKELLLSNPNFQKSPNGKKQVVKITYLPFLFIEYLEFSKIHCNLFNFKIQIILVKVGFYFLLSIVLKKCLLMVFFEFFQVNIGSWL